MHKKQKLSSLSAVIPAYNDSRSLPILIRKAVRILAQVAKDYEIIIVNDASTDNTAETLKTLKRKIPFLKIITHGKNRGYGGALISGFNNASKEYIFYTDADGQYDVFELKKLVAAMDNRTDIVTGYKLQRSDPWYRLIIGKVYNQLLKVLLGLKVRDVDCDFRLFKRSLLKDIKLTIISGTFDAEFIMQLERKKAKFKEIPVHHYLRLYGTSQFFIFHRIARSLFDLGRLWVLQFTYEK